MLSLLQVLGLQDARVRFEEATTPFRAQEVADLRTNEGRGDDHEDQGRQVQAQAVMQQAGREQQGFAGQHGEKHAGFDEDDEHRSPQDPRPHSD